MSKDNEMKNDNNESDVWFLLAVITVIAYLMTNTQTF